MLEELARYGIPTVKRAYGDWTTQHLVRLEGRAAAPRDPADPAVRLHRGQELHRLGADHRRDGPALLRQPRRLRDRLQRQRLHPARDPAARVRQDRLRPRPAPYAGRRSRPPATGSSTSRCSSRSRRPTGAKDAGDDDRGAPAARPAARSSPPPIDIDLPGRRLGDALGGRAATSARPTRRSTPATTASPSSARWPGRSPTSTSPRGPGTSLLVRLARSEGTAEKAAPAKKAAAKRSRGPRRPEPTAQAGVPLRRRSAARLRTVVTTRVPMITTQRDPDRDVRRPGDRAPRR